MTSEISELELRSSQDIIGLQGHWAGVMEGAVRKTNTVESKSRDHRPIVRANTRSQNSFSLSYFSVVSLLVLLCLTASLLLLPLILPPLPPPPFMLLLIPVGILFVLVILAFMPSDAREIASSYA